MALSVDFSVTQSLANPNELTFTDLSSGSDSGVTTRRIYILTANGTYLVESGTTVDYELWALPLGTAITLDVLTQATSPSIKVDWMTGSTVTYTKTELYDFNLQLYLFAYQLTQSQLSSPQIVQDTNYYGNKIKLLVNIKDSGTAIDLMSDIYNGQAALDRGTYLVNNESLFF